MYGGSEFPPYFIYLKEIKSLFFKGMFHITGKIPFIFNICLLSDYLHKSKLYSINLTIKKNFLFTEQKKSCIVIFIKCKGEDDEDDAQ